MVGGCDPQFIHSACPSVPVQDVECQIAPDGCAGSVWVMCDRDSCNFTFGVLQTHEGWALLCVWHDKKNKSGKIIDVLYVHQDQKSSILIQSHYRSTVQSHIVNSPSNWRDLKVLTRLISIKKSEQTRRLFFPCTCRETRQSHIPPSVFFPPHYRKVQKKIHQFAVGKSQTAFLQDFNI